MHSDFVRDRRGQDIARGPSIRRGRALCRVDLGIGINACGPHQRKVRVLHIVEYGARVAVKPKVGHHPVNARIRACWTAWCGRRSSRCWHDGDGRWHNARHLPATG